MYHSEPTFQVGGVIICYNTQARLQNAPTALLKLPEGILQRGRFKSNFFCSSFFVPSLRAYRPFRQYCKFVEQTLYIP
jgi:hypothetical protein